LGLQKSVSDFCRQNQGLFFLKILKRKANGIGRPEDREKRILQENVRKEREDAFSLKTKSYFQEGYIWQHK
jgi:hypothetical protein